MFNQYILYSIGFTEVAVRAKFLLRGNVFGVSKVSVKKNTVVAG